MTAQKNTNNARDEVLYAFQQECERPTAAQITEWVRRYPEFADDIRDHAAIARDWDAREGMPVEAPDERMLARGHSRVLNAIYNAQVAATTNPATEPCQSFQQLMSAKGTDVPRLAKELNIARSVLADLINGGMLAPVGRRLVKALTENLGITEDVFDTAFWHALTTPRLGHAKAIGTPSIIPRGYEDVIRSSNMSADRVQYWLSTD